MTQQPLVSIIIPVYKVERFLPACVESVLMQTYSQLDIILVDDGSPDNCPALCDTYAEKDARVRVIHQQNGGLSRARNAGLAAASGKYVYFLDSDDTIVPEAIELLVQTAEATESDIVFFESLLTAEDGGTHPEENAHHRRHAYDTPMRGAKMLQQLIANGEFMTPVPYLFFRRTFMEGRQFEPDLLYEDVLFSFLAFLDANRVVGLNEALYRYRIRGNSIMTGSATLRHHGCLIRIYHLIEARLQDADAAMHQAIVSELSTLYHAEMHLYHRLFSAANRRAARNAHRSFLESITASEYAKASPDQFSASAVRIRLTAWVHRILSANQRKKLRALLKR